VRSFLNNENVSLYPDPASENFNLVLKDIEREWFSADILSQEERLKNIFQ